MYLSGSRSIFHRDKLEQSIKDDELLSELSSKVYNIIIPKYFVYCHIL